MNSFFKDIKDLFKYDNVQVRPYDGFVIGIVVPFVVIIGLVFLI